MKMISQHFDGEDPEEPTSAVAGDALIAPAKASRPIEKRSPAKMARLMADSAAQDSLNTQQAIELAQVYATLDLAAAIRTNNKRSPRA